MPKFSNAEKAQELKRELGMRRHVYPRRVADGKMQQAAADRSIALAEDMLADYERLAAIDMPDLFAPAPLVDQARALEDEVADRPPARYEPRKEVGRRLAPAPSSDPTYGKTPGINIEREGQKCGTCKCGESTLTGQVRDVMTGTLNYRVFDAKPLEHDGKNYYTRHRCDAARN